MTALDVVTGALRELAVLNASDVASGDDAQLGLDLLNELLDTWNADQQAVYGDQFLSFTITPSLQPHTIGLAADTPTWVVTGNRPESIDGASLVLTNVTPNVYLPLTIRDAAWYQMQPVPTVTTTIPTDLYYDATWPKGSIYLLPVPTVAYGVRLRTRTVLAQLTLVSTFTLPPGYARAIRLTLAEALVNALHVALPQMLSMDARAARATVFANNVTTPKLATRDSGMPGGSRGATFNYLTGSGR